MPSSNIAVMAPTPIERVFYLIPHNTEPCGGIKVMYQHCRMLDEAGIKAFPLHEGRFSLDWFDHRLTPVNISDLPSQLSSTDVLVGTEVFPYALSRFKGARKVMLVQGAGQILPAWRRGPRNPGLAQKVGRRFKAFQRHPSYQRLGYERVLTCSPYLQAFLWSKHHIESTVVTNGIDLDLLCYEPARKEPGTVLCLTRKNPKELARVKTLVSDVRFVEVDSLDFSSLVKQYQQADIFLNLAYPEGFSLPPLEAMACGCAVVGFDGGGARCFMKHDQSALVAPDGDCEKVAGHLSDALRQPELKERIRQGGLRMSQEFSQERTRTELLEFFESLGS